MEIEKEIKDAIKNRKLVIGTRTVIKDIKNSRLESVICASNCPTPRIRDLEHYLKISKIELKRFGEDSTKLGEACGKPFTALVIGIKK